MYLYVFVCIWKEGGGGGGQFYNDKYLFLVVFKTILLWMTIKIYMVK